MSIDSIDSRRKFLQTSGLGIGWLAALDHVPAKRRGRHRGSAGPQSAAVARHGQKRDLPVHAGRAQPGGHVRSRSRCSTKLHGQHPPESFGDEDFQNGKFHDSMILGSKRTFKKYGQSGIEVSDLFPHDVAARRRSGDHPLRAITKASRTRRRSS